MKIGFIHLGSRVDSWARYYLWVLRNEYPQHQIIVMGEDTGSRQFRWRNDQCDVYIHIDDGLNYQMPEQFKPLIYICSDSHMNDGVQRKEFAKKADYSFCCQKSAVGDFGREWLPHAAYYFPPINKNIHTNFTYDVSSIMMLSDSNPFFAKRTALANQIKSLTKRCFINTGPVHERMIDIYSQSQIVWNYCLNEDINMRLFEAAAAGVCILSNRLHINKVEELFKDLIVLYDHEEDMIEKCQYLLTHKNECIERGLALRSLVEPKNNSDLGQSYSARVKRVLEVAEKLVQDNNV